MSTAFLLFSSDPDYAEPELLFPPVSQHDPQPVKYNPEHPGLKLVLIMLDSIKAVHSMSFNLKALERVEGKFLTAESKIRLSVNPKMIYFRNEKKKISLLWKAGVNGDNALVKAKMLFNTSLSLDPYGNMMRKNQHYTIHELGFNFFATTLSSAILKSKEQLEKKLVYIGKKVVFEKTCHIMVYEDADFGYFDYKTGKNESVSSLAIKFNVSDYAIRTKNNLHSFYGAVKEGRELKIPNGYCKKIVFSIDEKTMLPVSITTYDDIGLYENYEYFNVEINKRLSPEDFSQFYKD
jgi:hypothetical protein